MAPGTDIVAWGYGVSIISVTRRRVLDHDDVGLAGIYSNADAGQVSDLIALDSTGAVEHEYSRLRGAAAAVVEYAVVLQGHRITAEGNATPDIIVRNGASYHAAV